VLIGIVFDLYL